MALLCKCKKTFVSLKIRNNTPMTSYRYFIVTLLLTLLSAVNANAQFSRLSIGKYGIQSVSPEGFSAVNGAVWLEVANPGETFTVSDIKGTVYKDGSPFVKGTAPGFTVLNGSSKVTVSGHAGLCEGVSLWSLFSLVVFEPEDYTVDISMKITTSSGKTRVAQKKGMPLKALLKLK